MSTTGTTNQTLANIVRVDAQARGKVNVLRSTTTPYRKATRSRASTVIVRQTMPWSTNMTDCVHKERNTQGHMIANASERWMPVAQDNGREFHATIGQATKPTVVRPGGRTTLGDYHK